MKKIHHDPALTLIPRVVLDVHADGSLTASVDGTPLDPPPSAGPWRRSSLGQIIDVATGGRATPARVEVRESDGTAFTDFVTPRSRRSRMSQEPVADDEDLLENDPSASVSIEGTGFVPAEDVAVAVIVGHTAADRSGMALALLDPASLPGHEVVLLGRKSATLVIRRLR